jgi:L-ascorbate metabolism protein UlaG (beta-lactamase superfamily)
MLQLPKGAWSLAVCYVNHAGFAIAAPDGTVLLIDPFLSPTFPWQGGTERQLDAPPFGPQDLAPCSAIAITHDHADHFDVETCRAILARSPGARLIGPALVVEQGRAADLPAAATAVGEPRKAINVASLIVMPLANRGSEDQRPCPRFSYLVTGAREGGRAAAVFHSGDSHGPSESWRGLVEDPDLALLWPAQIEDAVAAVHPRRVWLMHWGRFEPGNFLCNVDVAALAAGLRSAFPECEVISSPPGGWVAV